MRLRPVRDGSVLTAGRLASRSRMGVTMTIELEPIGVVHTPHTRPEDTPIQPVYAEGIPGSVELLPEYEAGLRDIEGFSHVYLIYVFHRAKAARLEVTPYLGDETRGVFATRSPHRPNHIGVSLVRLVGREGRTLAIEDVDMLDGSPLLDIKPFSGRFETREGIRSGWLDEVDADTARKRGRRGYRGKE